MKKSAATEDFTLKKNAESAKAIAALKSLSIWAPEVEKVIAMPNARKDDFHLPYGVVYCCRGGARAGPIIGDEGDFCAGVSLHHIKKFPASAAGGKDSFVLKAFSKWTHAASTPFHDYSVRRSDTEEKVSLGPQGSSVMIMKTDAADPKWFICVKSYSHDSALAALSASDDTTVAQLYESAQYKHALRAGATTRAAVAASVAECLGLDVGAVTGKTSPGETDIVTLAPVWAECLYNVIERDPDAPDSYAYFRHCYALNTCSAGVPVFHRAAAGATFFNISEPPGGPFPAFPMTFPFEGGAGSLGGSAPCIAASVFWGGMLCHNKFLQKDLAVSHELGPCQREWSARLEQLGFDYKDGSTRLIAVASYISTAQENIVPLASILDAAPRGVDIYLPVNHDSIIALLRHHDQIREEDPSIILADFLRQEDTASGYFVVNTDMLRKLKDAIGASERTKIKSSLQKRILPATPKSENEHLDPAPTNSVTSQ